MRIFATLRRGRQRHKNVQEFQCEHIARIQPVIQNPLRLQRRHTLAIDGKLELITAHAKTCIAPSSGIHQHVPYLPWCTGRAAGGQLLHNDPATATKCGLSPLSFS